MHDELHELALRLDIDALELTGLVLASLIVVKRQVAKARPLTVEIVVSESREQLNSRGNLALVRQDLHLRDCRESLEKLDADLLRVFAEASSLPALCLRGVEIQLDDTVIGVFAGAEDNLEACAALCARHYSLTMRSAFLTKFALSHRF